MQPKKHMQLMKELEWIEYWMIQVKQHKPKNFALSNNSGFGYFTKNIVYKELIV